MLDILKCEMQGVVNLNHYFCRAGFHRLCLGEVLRRRLYLLELFSNSVEGVLCSVLTVVWTLRFITDVEKEGGDEFFCAAIEFI